MIPLYWCSICNKKPAEGTLTVKENDTGELIPLHACQDCVDKLDWRNNEQDQ